MTMGPKRYWYLLCPHLINLNISKMNKTLSVNVETGGIQYRNRQHVVAEVKLQDYLIWL